MKTCILSVTVMFVVIGFFVQYNLPCQTLSFLHNAGRIVNFVLGIVLVMIIKYYRWDSHKTEQLYIQGGRRNFSSILYLLGNDFQNTIVLFVNFSLYTFFLLYSPVKNQYVVYVCMGIVLLADVVIYTVGHKLWNKQKVSETEEKSEGERVYSWYNTSKIKVLRALLSGAIAMIILIAFMMLVGLHGNPAWSIGKVFDNIFWFLGAMAYIAYMRYLQLESDEDIW